MKAVEHPGARSGNPGASRSWSRPRGQAWVAHTGGGATAVIVRRARDARRGCAGTVARPRAVRPGALRASRRGHSSADRGRSGCKAALARGTARTRTGGRDARPGGGLLGGKLPEAASPSRSHALRWTTTSGNATLAPHPLLACVGYGVRLSLPGKWPSPYPPTSGHGARSTADGRPRPTPPRRRHSRAASTPGVKRPPQKTSPWRLPCRAASKANSCPVDLHQPTGCNTAQCKTASSPPNKRGS